MIIPYQSEVMQRGYVTSLHNSLSFVNSKKPISRARRMQASRSPRNDGIPRNVAFVQDYFMTASGTIQKFKLHEMTEALFPERI